MANKGRIQNAGHFDGYKLSQRFLDSMDSSFTEHRMYFGIRVCRCPILALCLSKTGESRIAS